MKRWFAAHWLQLLALAMLCGLFANPAAQAYYQLMGWIVTGAAIITALHAAARNHTFLMWCFIFLAVIFNPVAPLHLSELIWQVVNAATIGILFAVLAYHPYGSAELRRTNTERRGIDEEMQKGVAVPHKPHDADSRRLNADSHRTNEDETQKRTTVPNKPLHTETLQKRTPIRISAHQ